MAGKFEVIAPSDGKTVFDLLAGNGQVIPANSDVHHQTVGARRHRVGLDQ